MSEIRWRSSFGTYQPPEPSCCSYSNCDTEYLTATEDFASQSDYESCQSDAEWMWKTTGTKSFQKRTPGPNIRRQRAKLSGVTNKPTVSKTVRKLKELENRNQKDVSVNKTTITGSAKFKNPEPSKISEDAKPSTSGVRKTAWKGMELPEMTSKNCNANEFVCTDAAGGSTSKSELNLSVAEFPPLKPTESHAPIYYEKVVQDDASSSKSMAFDSTDDIPTSSNTTFSHIPDCTAISPCYKEETPIWTKEDFPALVEATVRSSGAIETLKHLQKLKKSTEEKNETITVEEVAPSEVIGKDEFVRSRNFDCTVIAPSAKVETPIWTTEDFPSLVEASNCSTKNDTVERWPKPDKITEKEDEKNETIRIAEVKKPTAMRNVVKRCNIDWSIKANVAANSTLWKTEDFPSLGGESDCSGEVKYTVQPWRKPEKLVEENSETSTIEEETKNKVIRNVAVTRRSVIENNSEVAHQVTETKKTVVNNETPFVKVLKNIPINMKAPWRVPSNVRFAKYNNYHNDTIESEHLPRSDTPSSTYSATLNAELVVEISEDDAQMKPRKDRWLSSDSGILSEFDEAVSEEEMHHNQYETEELTASPFGYKNHREFVKFRSKNQVESDDEMDEDFFVSVDWELERALEESRKKTLEDALFDEMEAEFNTELHRLLLKGNTRIPSKDLEQLRVDSSVKVLNRFCRKMFPDIVNE